MAIEIGVYVVAARARSYTTRQSGEGGDFRQVFIPIGIN